MKQNDFPGTSTISSRFPYGEKSSAKLSYVAPVTCPELQIIKACNRTE